ncbi:MAG: benzoate/H(+) symporter BenE family transporter [Betaproteobacteria bacterium]|nr:benzoate/H(+) symporter BenE family transporter [Betaproteobacteria bacterium]MBU6511502.1 benzoate/H(+) symporter BenE family transporter [Betaproteobacteria bacterium]MDE1954389.1 benzoate/H(+) symporter BenE family transporter [Betaproteobacteria bacterium]MDE2151078.1 benzoate/H(+) symporter BenE family transporter [Betaproteobacteria bacterium]MDE2478283.1 benzoate/H(+) symporter BenE family transporter [Betaproteobacteria bacterium]
MTQPATPTPRHLARWFSPSHVSAGFVTVLVGYTSSAAIVFEAARAAGAGPAEIASWLWALGLGMGLSCIGLSLRYRAPVLTAWSTPGAALLATSLHGVPMAQALGVFVFASALAALAGFSGWFERLMHRIPRALAAGMLAGVLLEFGLGVFGALQHRLGLVGAMLLTLLVARRWLARYAVALSFAVGLLVATLGGDWHLAALPLRLTHPVWVTPSFAWSSLLGIGLPLFIVSMASQNVPGIAMLRTHGYSTPASPLVGWTGLLGVLLAPFGGFSYNLAAITAAICMSPEADPDPRQRWRAAVWAGVFYAITGLLGASVAALFAAFPHALVAAIAGLALLSTIGNSLAGALADEAWRDGALVTFLVTASGFTLGGIGSALWGLLLGMATAALTRRG